MCIDMNEKRQCNTDYSSGYVAYEYEYIEQDTLLKIRSDTYLVSTKMQTDDRPFKKSRNKLTNVENLKTYAITTVDLSGSNQ